MEKKKKEMIRLIRFIVIILLLFFLFLFIKNRKVSYNLDYIVNNIKVIEKYNKEKSYYEIIFNYKRKDYKSLVFNEYLTDRYLVDDIKVKEKDDIVCLIGKSKELKLYPVCSSKEGYIGNNNYLIKNELSKVKLTDKNYEDIHINYLNSKTFLVWNYKGIYLLNEDSTKNIKLLNKDVYSSSLLYLKDNYFMYPDYENEHYFNYYNIYNITNGKKQKLKFKNSISFDSYILGDNDKSVFLFDKKNMIEYELVPFKPKYRTIKPKTIIGGKWVSITSNKLKNDFIKFDNNDAIKYYLDSDNLYCSVLDYKEYITDNVKEIIKQDNDEIYYIKDDKVYLYSPYKGEILLFDWFELNFNYDNMIFVY